MPSVLIPFADGVEEMEAVILVDVLRRGGLEVTTAGMADGPVTASRGVRLLPDRAWSDVQPNSFEALAIPGGAEGVNRLKADARILEAVRSFHRHGKWIAAICAGPLVLQEAGILQGRRITCHPAVADRLTATPRTEERVVIDGNLVTSQGPGTSFEFALALVRCLLSEEKSLLISKAMILPL